MKKRFKITKDIIYIISLKLLYNSKIHNDFKLINIWKEIKQFYSCFYYIKNIIEARFNNIKVVITNSKKKFELNLISSQKFVIPNIDNLRILLLLLENMDLKHNRENSFFWPIDNKLKKDKTSNIKELES